MKRGLTALLLVYGIHLRAQVLAQPPGSHPESCVETVKSYLSSSEYNGEENLEKIRTACIDVDSRCVQIVGDSLSSSERRDAVNFLPLVRSCAGGGKAECYSDILETTPSFDRSTAKQAAGLLKKCEADKP